MFRLVGGFSIQPRYSWNDRERYYAMLSLADKGTEQAGRMVYMLSGSPLSWRKSINWQATLFWAKRSCIRLSIFSSGARADKSAGIEGTETRRRVGDDKAGDSTYRFCPIWKPTQVTPISLVSWLSGIAPAGRRRGLVPIRTKFSNPYLIRGWLKVLQGRRAYPWFVILIFSVVALRWLFNHNTNM